jgi:hypothetical protein
MERERERERRALVYFHRSELLGKKREPLWRTGKGINTPLPSNGHLSAAISRYDTVAPTKTAKGEKG